MSNPRELLRTLWGEHGQFEGSSVTGVTDDSRLEDSGLTPRADVDDEQLNAID